MAETTNPPMHPKAARIYSIMKQAHEEVYQLLSDLRHETQSEVDIKKLADIAFAINESNKLAKDTEKETRFLHEVLSKKTGALWAIVGLQTATFDNIKTDYATTTPSVKQIVTLPRRDKNPKEFAALMNHLGVPEQLWNAKDQEAEVVRPHWPGLTAYLSEQMSQGLPLPPGIDATKTYPHYKLSHRRRKEPA